jgi:hypothetical protein
MSQWIHVDGHLNGVAKDLSDEKTPEGSEGGHPLSKYMAHNWMWHADLRDRGEEDASSIRDWFVSLCQRTQPHDAELTIDVEFGGRYDFTWDAGHQDLILEIPPLYRDALDDEHMERETNV